MGMKVTENLKQNVRAHFQNLYDNCGGAEAEQHSDWLPGVAVLAEDFEPFEEPEVLASYAYLNGVADAFDLGIMGMLDKVLGEY
jgi:hypothetical protein